MTMKTTIELALTQNLGKLNLPSMVSHLKSLLHQARQEGIDYEEFLLGLTEIELKVRAKNRFKRLLREAKFPCVKTFETFSFDSAPDLNRSLIEELETGKYIRERRNIIFVGKNGTGKTHLATALGIEACKQDVQTRFVTGCCLVNELLEARDNKILSKLIQKYSRHDLLILDDLGAVSHSQEGAELLFQVLAERHESRSVIITTNLEFTEWTNIFIDPTMTSVLLGRLTHRAYIIHCTWQRYWAKVKQ